MATKVFPTNGTQNFDYYGQRLGIYDLRGMSLKLGLAAPDVFPTDFNGLTYLSIPSNVTKTSSGQNWTIAIVAYSAWTLTDNATWLTLSSAGGSVSGNVTVTITANSGSQRVGTITLTHTATAETVTMTVTQSGAAATVYAVSLSYSGTSSTDACNRYPAFTSVYYANNTEWVSATKLYSNSAGTLNASTGWYSDGSYWRYWNGSTGAFTGAGAFCGFQ